MLDGLAALLNVQATIDMVVSQSVSITINTFDANQYPGLRVVGLSLVNSELSGPDDNIKRLKGDE